MSVKKSFKVLLIGVVLSLAAFGVWYFVHAQPTTEANVVPLSVPVFLQLDSFTVNLKQDGQFLQVQFTLQLETGADVTKIKMYIPQVRSRILLLLSNKTADELSTTDGKQTLNKQIVEVISEPLRIDLAPIKVVNVFATSFIMQ